MQPDEFYGVVEKYLLPMFAGASIDRNAAPIIYGGKTVAYDVNQTRLRVRPSKDVDWCLALQRSQGFTKDERNVVQNFINVLSDYLPWKPESLPAAYFRYALARMVAKSIADPGQEQLIADIIGHYESWSEQTYEGSRISVSVGIDIDDPTQGGVGVLEVYANDFGRVLANGIDTMLVCTSTGMVLQHETLTSLSTKTAGSAPLRYLPLAVWSKGGRRVAIALNRNGELLVFKGGELVFAKRRGEWRHFTHEPIQKQMLGGRQKTWKPELREAVYESCLDASFARTGACIGLLRRGMAGDAKDRIEPNDLLSGASSVKSACMAKIIGKGLFQELDRHLRQEMLGVDGATILDYEGNVIAVGAIIEIDTGTPAGARLAAAMTLSRFGLGIKVSSDGEVKGFLGKVDASASEPLFRLA